MVKWIDTCQVSQEVCLLTQRAFHWRLGTLNPARMLHTGSPLPPNESPPTHGTYMSVGLSGREQQSAFTMSGYQDLE